MGLPDIYSTINAGSPGRYSASDANNGGAPGTVIDKVTRQMDGHRANAAKLLGTGIGMISQPSVSRETPIGGPIPPMTPATPAPEDTALMAALANIPKMLQAQQQNQVFAPAAVAPDNMRARMAAIAAARQLGQPS